ncbi:MAG: cupin domain-containing protein [Novosphingobium sp.]|nr:cupin domain-containing protein [Novosphingobium sp.]
MITCTARHFSGRDEAIAEIKQSGLHLAETELTPDELTGEAHDHPYGVEIYLLEGVLVLDDPATGKSHKLEAGSKAVVPADARHTETCSGPVRAVFGLTIDPAQLMAARTAEVSS